MIKNIAVKIIYYAVSDEIKNNIANQVLDIIEDRLIDKFIERYDDGNLSITWDVCYDDYQILMCGNDRKVNIVLDFDESLMGSKNVDANDIESFVTNLKDYIGKYNFIANLDNESVKTVEII